MCNYLRASTYVSLFVLYYLCVIVYVTLFLCHYLSDIICVSLLMCHLCVYGVSGSSTGDFCHAN